MANRKLSPEELAELVNSTPEMRKFVEDLGKSAMLSTLGAFIKKPTLGGALADPRVEFPTKYGTTVMRPESSAKLTGVSADTVILDEWSDDIWTQESRRLKAERDEKRAAERRAAEERQAHYKGDPLAGTF